MRQFLNNYKLDITFFLVLSLSFPLFFYKLGDSSLTSFDEAWYGEIARNIMNTGNLFQLSWNDNAYRDHPPGGFWLMAIFFKLFGVSEFWARFIPALSGFISIFLTYFIGKILFNRWVGFMSAVALTSATWFIFRARSGNLDTILTMFFLLSIFLSLKAAFDKRFLIPLSVSLMMLFLTKSLIPFTIIPLLLIIFIKSPVLKKISIKDLILPLIIFILPISIWFLTQLRDDQNFLNHYLKIGFPGRDAKFLFSETFSLYKEYLHNGIGKWFWPGILGLIGGLLIFRKKFLILFIPFITISIPFLFTKEGHIWHLIPLYPFMILAAFGFSYLIIERLINKKWAIILIFLLGFYFWFPQVKQNWYQFINVNAFVSDEAILSREAASYPYKLYIDGDFYPVAVFYSGKKVQQIWFEALPIIFKEEQPFLLITKKERLDGAKIPESNYEILKTDRDRILVLKK